MRVLAAGVAFLIAVSAAAQVTITTKKDGSKLITNFGGLGKGKASDLAWLAKQRNKRTKYDPIIERYSDRFGVDPVLVRAVIQVESSFDPRCVSHRGAKGLMQLMPETAERYGVKSIFDPDQNISGGVHYLSDLLRMFPRDLPRALAAYNAGENAVLRYAGIPPYDETMTYVKRALTVYYGSPYGQATWYSAGKGERKLSGGFGGSMLAPIMMPGMRYLGTH